MNYLTLPNISIKNGQYIVVLKVDKVTVSFNGNVIASYDLFYDNNRNNYTGLSICYLINSITSKMYFSDVHLEEIKEILNNNSTIQFNRTLIYYDNFKHAFYWLWLGYEIKQVDNYMQMLKRFLKQELSQKSKSVSDIKFENISYEFAEYCEKLIVNGNIKGINCNIIYVCEKEI